MTGSLSFTAAVMVQKPSMAADILTRVDTGEAVALLLQQSTSNAAVVIIAMSPWAAGRLLGAMPAKEAAAIVADMPVQAAVDALKTLNDQNRTQLLAALPEHLERSVSHSLSYHASQVGAWITREIPVLHRGETVGDVGKIPDLEGHEQQIYLVSEARQLEGILPVTRLIDAAGETPLSRLAVTDVPPLVDTAPVSRAANVPAWDDFLRLPVISPDGTLVGDISRKAVRSAVGQTGALALDLEANSMLGALSLAYLTTASGLLQMAVEQPTEGGAS